MTTEANAVGHLLAQAISDVQSDTKRAITALILSLHSSGQLNSGILKEVAEKMLQDVPDRTPQNSGILETVLAAAQAIQEEKLAKK